MVIFLICMILLGFALGSFITIKSIQIGLRWQIQAKQEQKPTVSNPITDIKQAVENKKVVKDIIEQQNVVKEWLYGEQEDKKR